MNKLRADDGLADGFRRAPRLLSVSTAEKYDISACGVQALQADSLYDPKEPWAAYVLNAIKAKVSAVPLGLGGSSRCGFGRGFASFRRCEASREAFG